MKYLVIVIISIISIGTCTTAQSSKIDHSAFDKLLKENVDDKGMVDYKAFQYNKLFEEYLNQIATSDLSKTKPDEKLAFYINAYNALTIKNVLNYYPIGSPMDVEGFFKEKKFKVAGMDLSLDELEHKHVLPINNVLPHFGLVCAAVSCPKLIRKAYSSETVLNQLKINAREFLNDESKNRLEKESKILYLSSIFKWFRKSFEEEYITLQEAVKTYMNEDDKKFLNQNEVEIQFLKYNWKLNSQ
jgi:hypothetical protein